MPKKAKPVTKKAAETEDAYIKRLMKSLYGRTCDMKHIVGKDGKPKLPKKVTAE
jgi:cytochrome c5